MKKVLLFEEFLNEATTSWSKMMKGVKAGESGPWSLVAIENNKVVGQRINIQIRDILPAEFEAFRKEYPKAKIHIEDSTGGVVWNESYINESEAYTISRMANDVGLGRAEDFLDKYNVDLELLANAVRRGSISKYELRDIINGDVNSSKMKQFVKTYVNESVVNEARTANYKMLVDVLLNAQPNYDVYYNDSHNVVNVGGVGYSGGDLTRALKLNPGQADSVKNEFYYAKEDPKETKKQIEKLSKGKIEVDISSLIVKYKVNESFVNEAKTLTREELMDLLKNKYKIKTVRTSEEFNGQTEGIWVAGDNEEELSGNRMFDYYNRSAKYVNGILKQVKTAVEKTGWRFEWNDPGTILIWPNN